MLFNSFTFLIFFPTVVLVYFTLPFKYRWVFLLFASYYFYINWVPIYALLMLLSTIVTWVCGRLVEKNNDNNSRKTFLVISLFINFGILFFYKYFNFINNSVFNILDLIGISWPLPNLDVLLPVGISFYTFQAVGYTIDVYRNKIKAERNFGIYALFVSFFPQLVAGPIERTENLIPQFKAKKSFDYANLSEGAKQMIWGYFMKVVVADRLAIYVNAVYNNVDQHSGFTFILATIFFAFQIYCDFAGYSNIAIGAAKIMGFSLMTNFRQPYQSASISEFWKRWHISLSTWFRDYVYISLGGNRVSKRRRNWNLFVTFFLSGIWHGANWTFVIWGTLNGFYLIISLLTVKFRESINKLLPISGRIGNLKRILSTFALTCFAWIFFRANNVSEAFLIIKKIFSFEGQLYIGEWQHFFYSIFGILTLLVFERLQVVVEIENYPVKLRSWIKNQLFYAALVLLILIVGVFDGGQFIYFQF